MKLKEIRQDLFRVNDKHFYLAHCISSDCKMGAGIAIKFNKKYDLRNILLNNYTKEERRYPNCILENRVLNLITKRNFWDKPSYESLQSALNIMKNIVTKNQIKYVAMPKIGCGLDRLEWVRVKEILHDTFSELDLNILVCYL